MARWSGTCWPIDVHWNRERVELGAGACGGSESGPVKACEYVSLDYVVVDGGECRCFSLL
ncbi:hypothetical protein MtrunA17_Chr1g0178911 [Medicago truncatula]|uniref:Uncharacterized protein n=1 Tax=Medicago truncatula TaxID=3880 RepID=A0A396JMR2_MEDTR|nr:hypothetical protein MtrunA17_Chr1g0178911 [Medicago truncatula]